MTPVSTGIGLPLIGLIIFPLVLTAIGIIFYVLFASREKRGSLRERLPSVGAVAWALPVVAVTALLVLRTGTMLQSESVVRREVAVTHLPAGNFVPPAVAVPVPAAAPVSAAVPVPAAAPATVAGHGDNASAHVVTTETVRQERERLQEIVCNAPAKRWHLANQRIGTALERARLARAYAFAEQARVSLELLDELSIPDIRQIGLDVKLIIRQPGKAVAANDSSTDSPRAADARPNDENNLWTVTRNDLPEWVTQPPQQIDNSTLLAVGSRQYSTVEEAEREALELAAWQLGEDFHRFYPKNRGSWTVSRDLAQTAIRNKHVETIQRRTSTSQTPFEVKRVYLQVELSEAVREEFYGSWREQVVQKRLWTLGSLAGMLTLMFGTGAMYFRLDARTGGAYRRRLKLAAVSLIVAGGVVAAAIA